MLQLDDDTSAEFVLSSYLCVIEQSAAVELLSQRVSQLHQHCVTMVEVGSVNMFVLN